MRKSCKKLQVGVAVGTVDINYIGTACIKRRGKIKCRTQEIFHRFVDIADFIISGTKQWKILLLAPTQILKGRFWLKILNSTPFVSLGRSEGCSSASSERCPYPRKLSGKTLLDFFHRKITSGLRLQKIAVIFSSSFKMLQSAACAATVFEFA